MQLSDIVHKIEDARHDDQFGVITPLGLQKQLGSMTASDWQNAATTYQKDAARDNGFYITDTPANKVTIHNDTSKAMDAATTSTFKLALHDTREILDGAIDDSLVVLGSAYLLGFADKLSWPALAVAALASNIGFDVAKNESLNNKATDALRHDQTVSFTPGAKNT